TFTKGDKVLIICLLYTSRCV
ncbi:hypothetical protein AZZ66_002182, partial [Escherichia coli]